MPEYSAEEIQELLQRLEEAEETLRAIRCGEVDALVVAGTKGDQIFTLQGADHPYRTLIEVMQQGAASLSDDGTVLFCNRRFAEILQTPHERLVGAKVSRFLVGSQRTLFEGMLREAQTATIQGELQFHPPEGATLPSYVALAPLSLEKATSVCMVLTDLTEQKKHQGLQETNRRKDEFLAMLAHELRNPLAPIRNGLEIMKLAKNDPVIIEEIRTTMERQTQQLITLVDDLLEVSRITRGKLELRKCQIQLADVIQSAVEASQPLMDGDGHKLVLRVPEQPIYLQADPNRLAQVFSNLLNNAAKYTPPGGHIELRVERDAEEAVVLIKDNGIGIPAEMLDYIFEMFAQVEHPLEKSYSGLGIGLTLVRSLVELHGGSIEVRSAGLNSGSEFQVRLPVLQLPVPSSAAPADPQCLTPKKKFQVLIVDDNLAAVQTMSMVIQMLGNDVRTATDGQQAIDMVAEGLPDLVLMDIGMPNMNGYEAARRIRKHPGGDKILLVALTGWGHDDDKQRTKAAGFDHHLTKPADPTDLRRLLSQLDQRVDSP